MLKTAHSMNGRAVGSQPAMAQSRIQVNPAVAIEDADALSRVYTPGVAQDCRKIADDPAAAGSLTIRGNSVAVISDGSAVLGLGDIGALAALPVLEGKAALYKRFAGIDAWPLCLDSRDVPQMARCIAGVAPGFGAISLEDVAAPRCFELEERLREVLDVPVFHDDQHGTAVVVLGALRNALRVTGGDLAAVRIVIVGAGAAGTAIVRLLQAAGARSIAVFDSHGPLHPDREDLTGAKAWLAGHTQPAAPETGLDQALDGADVFIGVSAGGLLKEHDVAAMADNAIVFALANPEPEIDPEIARRHAAVVATGRSDEPNQINNVLAFPGIVRGLLDSGARELTIEAQLAAARAIADVVPERERDADHIVPDVFDGHLAPAVARAVREA
jgi:malate dehydrogenase (oxaloacetate-decarboxylating)